MEGTEVTEAGMADMGAMAVVTGKFFQKVFTNAFLISNFFVFTEGKQNGSNLFVTIF